MHAAVSFSSMRALVDENSGNHVYVNARTARRGDICLGTCRVDYASPGYFFAGAAVFRSAALFSRSVMEDAGSSYSSDSLSRLAM